MSKPVYPCHDCKYRIRERNFGILITFCMASGVRVFHCLPQTDCGNYVPKKAKSVVHTKILYPPTEAQP